MEKVSTDRAIVGLISELFILVAVTCFFPNVLGASEVWREVVNCGVAWLAGAFISWIGMMLILPTHAEWPKWFELASLIICFPFFLTLVIIFLPFPLPSLWTMYRNQRLAIAVDKDFKTLWPRIAHYRSKGANSPLERLRVLAVDKSTPPQARKRIKKFIPILEQELAETATTDLKQNSQTA